MFQKKRAYIQQKCLNVVAKRTKQLIVSAPEVSRKVQTPCMGASCPLSLWGCHPFQASICQYSASPGTWLLMSAPTGFASPLWSGRLPWGLSPNDILLKSCWGTTDLVGSWSGCISNPVFTSPHCGIHKVWLLLHWLLPDVCFQQQQTDMWDPSENYDDCGFTQKNLKDRITPQVNFFQ